VLPMRQPSNRYGRKRSQAGIAPAQFEFSEAVTLRTLTILLVLRTPFPGSPLLFAIRSNWSGDRNPAMVNGRIFVTLIERREDLRTGAALVD
jgi:hypothetical protein